MPGLGIRRRRWFGWFRPNHVSGMVAWYDPTRQPGADGSAIDTMIDYSASGINATQSVVADRPTMVRNAQNGKSAALFSGGFGTGDCMDSGDNFNLDDSGFIMYVAWKPQLTPTDTKIAILIDKGGNCTVSACLGSYGINILWPFPSPESSISVSSHMIIDVVGPGYVNPQAEYTAGAAINNTWSVVGAVYELSQYPKMYTNGNLVATGVNPIPSSVSGLTNSRTFNIGKGFQPATDYRANGYIGEIVVYHKDSISGDQRQKLDGYLCHKWGTASSLPISSPYYYYPP